MKSHIRMQGDNRKQEEIRAKQEKVRANLIEKIQKIVDREFAEGKIESKAMCLEAIREEIRNTREIDKENKKYIIEMINGRIKEEIYYEQVEDFTNGFQFLSEYPELIDATSGFRKRKFTDRESYDRFCDLRKSVQCGISEYSQIDKLLEDKSISDTDKKILEARKSVMDKEIAKRREIEGR